MGWGISRLNIGIVRVLSFCFDWWGLFGVYYLIKITMKVLIKAGHTRTKEETTPQSGLWSIILCTWSSVKIYLKIKKGSLPNASLLSACFHICVSCMPGLGYTHPSAWYTFSERSSRPPPLHAPTPLTLSFFPWHVQCLEGHILYLFLCPSSVFPMNINPMRAEFCLSSSWLSPQHLA